MGNLTARGNNNYQKTTNLSEGEVSDHDDVYLISSEEKSNYTNTSVCRIGRNKDDDSSSQTSGFSINYA